MKKPSLENLADIAEVLGVTLNDLVSPPEADDDYRKDIETVIRHGFRFFLILYRRYAPVAYSLLSLVHSLLSLILYDRPLVNTICSGSHYIPTAIFVQII